MNVFHTDMERIQEINELRKGILPKDFVTNFPKIVSASLFDISNLKIVVVDIKNLKFVGSSYQTFSKSKCR